MPYTKLSEFIDRNKLVVSEYSAAEIHRQQIVPYNQLELPKLAQLLVPTFGMLAVYLRTGDDNEYREYQTRLAEQRFAKGFEVEDIVRVSRIMEAEIVKLINQEFADPSQESLRQRYVRRVESINMLSNSIIIATRIKFQKS